MGRFHRVLRWFKVEDDSGNLSLTTVAFVVAMYCLMASKAISLPELAAFAVGLGGHIHRQVRAAKAKVEGVVAPTGAGISGS